MNTLPSEELSIMLSNAYKEGQKNGGIPPFTIRVKENGNIERNLNIIEIEETLQGIRIYVESPIQSVLTQILNEIEEAGDFERTPSQQRELKNIHKKLDEIRARYAIPHEWRV